MKKDPFLVWSAVVAWVIFLSLLVLYLSGEEGAVNGVLGTALFPVLFTGAALLA